MGFSQSIDQFAKILVHRQDDPGIFNSQVQDLAIAGPRVDLSYRCYITTASRSHRSTFFPTPTSTINLSPVAVITV